MRCYHSPSLRSRSRRFSLVALPLLILATAACGVRLTNAGGDYEMFEGIRLAGERRAGVELTLSVTLASAYPVPVRIACFYEDYDSLSDDEKTLAFEERAVKIGEAVIPPVPGGRPPGKDAPEQTISFRFSAPRAGEYFLACNTPAAADNGFGLSFEIE